MIKKNESFICMNCLRRVAPATKGNCRNHCNFCLFSCHVDIEPGDRKHNCKGMMKPVKIERKKSIYYVLHKCIKCGVKKWNKIQEDDKIDSQLILLSSSEGNTDMKMHKGIKKRFKLAKSKRGKMKLKRQSKGRGSKHLKSKQSNSRKRRIKQVKKGFITKNLKRVIKSS